MHGKGELTHWEWKEDDGIRAVRSRNSLDADSVRRYLEGKFGEELNVVRSAMQKLAYTYRHHDLAQEAYPLCERFRPDIPAGKKGWGAKATSTWA